MLTHEQRTELIGVMRKRYGNAALARRARCVLLWAEGEQRVDIRSKLACNDAFVSRWTAAFDEQGLAGLVSLHPGRAPTRPVAKLEARVLDRTLKHLPRNGSTHWSSRKLAAELGDVSFSAVQRIWRKHGVRPHRLDTHMLANDPDFETKAADVIGLYLNPPAHVAVACVEEKTTIQALDRKDRMLQLSPDRAESHGFEYKRNGTLSLFAALNTAIGEVRGKTAARHTSEQFVTFLEDIVASPPRRGKIDVICDNVSSHKTDLVELFLAKLRRVHMHYTPTYSSWLNQVENWFARIQRDVITRGIFTSPKDLDKKLMQYIRQYNKDPKPLTGKYAAPTRRITAGSSDSVDWYLSLSLLRRVTCGNCAIMSGRHDALGTSDTGDSRPRINAATHDPFAKSAKTAQRTRTFSFDHRCTSRKRRVTIGTKWQSKAVSLHTELRSEFACTGDVTPAGRQFMWSDPSNAAREGAWPYIRRHAALNRLIS